MPLEKEGRSQQRGLPPQMRDRFTALKAQAAWAGVWLSRAIHGRRLPQLRGALLRLAWAAGVSAEAVVSFGCWLAALSGVMMLTGGMEKRMARTACPPA